MIGKCAWSVAAAVALVAGAGSVPAAAEAEVSCGYSVFSWPGGFSANLTITNRGAVIDGWTVRMTFPTATTLGSAWLATMVQSSAFDMIATNQEWNAVIPTGQVRTFGWTATGTDAVPTTVQVNGAPC